LIYSALFITIITLPLRDIELTAPIVIVTMIWWGFVFLLVWLSARRRQSWARWVLFGLFLLEVVLFLAAADYDQLSLREIVLSFCVSLMEGLAYYFVFTGNSRQWFASNSVKPAST
jgi:hypothetical protein